MVAVGNERQFGAMAEVLGLPDAAADRRFATNPDRVAHRTELRALIVDRLATRTASEWVDDLMAARVPAGVVNDIAGAFALAERLGLDPIVDVPLDSGGEIRLPRNPIGLSLTPPTYRSAPPPLAIATLRWPPTRPPRHSRSATRAAPCGLRRSSSPPTSRPGGPIRSRRR